MKKIVFKAVCGFIVSSLFLSAAFAETDKVQFYFDRGIKDLDSGWMEEAISDFTQVIALEPNTSEAYYNRGVAKANIFAKKGTIERTKVMMGGRSELVEDAISDFDKAISIESQTAQYYFARGSAYLLIRKAENAIADLTKGLEMDQSQPGMYLNRGLAYILTGNIKAGWIDIDRYKKGGAANPANNELINKLEKFKK